MKFVGTIINFSFYVMKIKHFKVLNIIIHLNMENRNNKNQPLILNSQQIVDYNYGSYV